MQRRRFVMSAVASALSAPFAGLAGCGGGSNDDAPPPPVPPSQVVLSLPKDMYLHVGAPTEWWWHTGTLRAGSRVFGFEINAASYPKFGPVPFAFTQVMLTDVERQRHYQRTVPFLPGSEYFPNTWAESDPAKNWFARLGDPDNHFNAIEVTNPGSGYTSLPLVFISGGGGSGAIPVPVLENGRVSAIALLSAGHGYTSEPTVTISGGGGSGATARAVRSYVAMSAPASDPTKNMAVKALVIDQATETPVKFDLSMSQQGRPFFVWGTGINPDSHGSGLDERNYYFSLTRLAVTGTIEVAGERHAVAGTTWMDHEYGAFGNEGNPVKWFLQDMQLDNGVCLSNYATIGGGKSPVLNARTPSSCTVQNAEGDTWFVNSFVTPVGTTWTSPQSHITYFLQFLVEIPAFHAMLTVTTPVAAQEFFGAASVYEGIATARGTFQGRDVSGTAWNEQAL